jgi:hypothetical protein
MMVGSVESVTESWSLSKVIVWRKYLRQGVRFVHNGAEWYALRIEVVDQDTILLVGPFRTDSRGIISVVLPPTRKAPQKLLGLGLIHRRIGV